jgi:hypothetical protein
MTFFIKGGAKTLSLSEVLPGKVKVNDNDEVKIFTRTAYKSSAIPTN